MMFRHVGVQRVMNSGLLLRLISVLWISGQLVGLSGCATVNTLRSMPYPEDKFWEVESVSGVFEDDGSIIVCMVMAGSGSGEKKDAAVIYDKHANRFNGGRKFWGAEGEILLGRDAFNFPCSVSQMKDMQVVVVPDDIWAPRSGDPLLGTRDEPLIFFSAEQFHAYSAGQYGVPEDGSYNVYFRKLRSTVVLPCPYIDCLGGPTGWWYQTRNINVVTIVGPDSSTSEVLGVQYGVAPGRLAEAPFALVMDGFFMTAFTAAVVLYPVVWVVDKADGLIPDAKDAPQGGAPASDNNS